MHRDPIYGYPDSGSAEVATSISIRWYRHGGACNPGMWVCVLPSMLQGYQDRTFHHCVVDDFGTLVEVPA